MKNDFSEDLKKVMLAGIGTVALSVDKSEELVMRFVERGELTVEQGKILNEEIKQNIRNKLKDIVSEDDNKDVNSAKASFLIENLVPCNT